MSKPMPTLRDLPVSSKMTVPMYKTYKIERMLGDRWQTIMEVNSMDYAMTLLKEWDAKLPAERHRLIMEITLHDTHRP